MVASVGDLRRGRGSPSSGAAAGRSRAGNAFGGGNRPGASARIARCMRPSRSWPAALWQVVGNRPAVVGAARQPASVTSPGNAPAAVLIRPDHLHRRYAFTVAGAAWLNRREAQACSSSIAPRAGAAVSAGLVGATFNSCCGPVAAPGDTPAGRAPDRRLHGVDRRAALGPSYSACSVRRRSRS
jgi:hypothetical protein